MPSDTDICNIALIKLGKDPVTDLTTGSGAKYRLIYDQNRTSLLREAPWNFARSFKSLTQLSTAPLGIVLLPDPDYGGGIVYTSAYQLPNDFIRLWRVSPYDAHWRLVGKTLYTDAAPGPATGTLIGVQPPNANGSNNPSVQNAIGTALGIEYILNVTDPNSFDQLFVDCLVSMVAQDLAWDVTGGTEMYDRMTQELTDKLKKAKEENEGEQWPEQLFDNVLVDVRYGYTNVSGTAFSGTN